MTYSIVAQDWKTGQFGVAVQSHAFSVGSIVPWARAGVGAVATQATAEVSYGPLGLDLLSAGKNARSTLDALLAADQTPEIRQVAVIDSKGRSAAHTGSRCIPFAGHTTGRGFSCQGNIMRSGKVWKEMRAAYEGNPRTHFAERLVGVLEAAERAGGDLRGKQSASLLVVSSRPSPSEWEGRLVDLRVEDNSDPLVELRRLLRIQRAYESAERGVKLVRRRRSASAVAAFERGFRLAPDLAELKFWSAISLLRGGHKRKGEDMMHRAFAQDPVWVYIARSLVAGESIEIDGRVLRAVISSWKRKESTPEERARS